MSDDICARCGEQGADRRTLWMACLYQMDEFRVPFEQVAIVGRLARFERKGKYGTAEFGQPGGEERSHPFYTLRVCKPCRGEWLAAIEQWFLAEPQGERRTGSGVFVRRCGVDVELTSDEVEALRRERGR